MAKKKTPEKPVAYDAKSFIIHGKRYLFLGGEFHYFRTPNELWEDRIVKMKRSGANFVATYIPWNWHEPVEGEERWTGDCDLGRFLDLCRKHGLYVVIKPGPYICAEWDFGGYPDWILGKKIPLRVLDERHMKYVDRWYKMVADVIGPHLVTNGGNIFSIQVENEYDHLMRLGDEDISEDDAKEYFRRLAAIMDKYGINIPKFANEAEFLHGSNIIDTRTYYPNIPWIWMWNFKYFDQKIVKAKKDQPNCPTMILELQSGWFSQFGQPMYIPGVELTEGVTKSTIMYGASLLNYYMYVGGTTFPFWGCRGDCSAHPVGQLESIARPIGNTTTFDFGGSAVREWGELMPGRYDFLRAFTLFTRDYQDLLVDSANVDSLAVLAGGEKVQRIHAGSANPDTGLTTEAENFTVITRKKGNQHLVCARNLDDRAKTITIGWAKTRQPVFVDLKVGPKETRLLPVNVDVPRAGVRIARSTSELLFAKKLNGHVSFGLYGSAGTPGETVLDVPKCEVKVLSGKIKVSGKAQAKLSYTHGGILVARVKKHTLVILDRELAGKVDELPHGLLISNTYFVSNIRSRGNTLALETSMRNGSKNAFHYIGRKSLTAAKADGKSVSVKKGRGPIQSFATSVPRTRSTRIQWIDGWKARPDTEEVKPKYRDDEWRLLKKPVALERAGLIKHGYIWYRAEFDLPAGAKDLTLDYVGNNIDRQRIFLNGKELWSGIGDVVEMDAQGAARKGKNVISVLYANFFHTKSHPSEGPIMKYSGIMGPLVVKGTRAGRKFRRAITQLRVREQLTGDLRGYADPDFDDSRWVEVPAGRRYIMEEDAGTLLWMRRRFRYRREPGWDGAVRLTIPDADERCLMWINGKPLGQFESVGPQHEFYVPETFLKEENVLTILLEGENGYLVQPKLDTWYEVKDVPVDMTFR